MDKDKVIYFLAGLAIGHILSKRESVEAKTDLAPSFVPLPMHLVQQMQQMSNPLPLAQHQQPQLQPPANPPKSCTFRCWLCDGTTSFHYRPQPGPRQFQVECSRCGMENLVKLEVPS